MAFEPNFEKITASYRKNIGSTQSQIDCKLPLVDDVKKVICSNAKASVTKAEYNGKEVVYSGYVAFQVVYLNNEGTPLAIDYTAEFNETYGYVVDGVVTPVVTANVVDVNTQVVGGEIKVVAIMETTIDGIFNESQNVLVGVVGDNVFVKNDILTYSSFVGTVQDRFEENNDLEIKDSVSKVLTVCPSVYLESVEVFDRYVQVKGGIFVDVSYVTDNNVIRTMQGRFDFSREVAGDDVGTDSFVQSVVQIALNDVKITTSLDADMAIVNVFVPIMYKGFVFNKTTVDVVSDLFSGTHYTGINVNSLPTMREYAELSFDDKISGSVEIQESAPFIDEMLGVCCGNVTLANASVNDGNFTVEGVAHTNVLYLNKELNTICSVEVEMPFSLVNPVDYPNESTPIVHLSLTEINARARRGKDIEVTATLLAFANFFENDKDAVITAVTEEDEVLEEDCALSIYLAKDGDTIWDIAKELRVSPESLIEQNPNLSEPIVAGTKIVVYRQKQVEYWCHIFPKKTNRNVRFFCLN